MRANRLSSIGSILAMAFTVIGCIPEPVTPKPAPAYARALRLGDPPPPKPVVVQVPPRPVTMPEQLKPMPPVRVENAKRVHAAPEEVVTEANKKAAQTPDPAGFFNAINEYVYEPGTLYQVYAAPMRITDLALQPGERIVGQPACGDTVRWVLAQGKSLAAGVEQWHVYLKPTRPGLETNLAINTDRHAYMLELRSYDETYMAVVTWRYPHDEVAKIEAEAAVTTAREQDAAPVVGLNSLNFNYAIQVIKGRPAWTPAQIFDDGRRTFIRFPQAMLVREAPALFVLRDKETQLVNYRVKRDFYVVDRLVESAELRVGGKDGEEIVRIVRTGVAK